MIKRKTKKQKEQDVKFASRKYIHLLIPAKKLIQELYGCEFDASWLRIGVISDLMKAVDSVNGAIRQSLEEFTWTDYEEDNGHTEWKNSTHISKYE
jgi:NDP-sugar pyrophosphorylase family protein